MEEELNKIIGESYFNLEKYAEAIPYLKEFKGRRGKWNNTDYYQLGYAYYKQGNYEEAISEFNKIVDGNNGVDFRNTFVVKEYVSGERFEIFVFRKI